MASLAPNPKLSGSLSLIVTVASLATLMFVSACQKEDTGRCCTVIQGVDPAIVPVPATGTGGTPPNIAKNDPRFDCEELACVSFQGSEAFCTRRCESHSCPEGFACSEVIQSDPGPGAQIPKDAKYCVPQRCVQKTDCPEDFECVLVHMSTNADDPEIKQCRRPGDLCAPK